VDVSSLRETSMANLDIDESIEKYLEVTSYLLYLNRRNSLANFSMILWNHVIKRLHNHLSLPSSFSRGNQINRRDSGLSYKTDLHRAYSWLFIWAHSQHRSCPYKIDHVIVPCFIPRASRMPERAKGIGMVGVAPDAACCRATWARSDDAGEAAEGL